MLNTALRKNNYQSFMMDSYNWFTEKRFAHMEKWQYLEPSYNGDEVNSTMLWDKWEQEASKSDNMLQRQGKIIQDQIHDMVEITKPCKRLIDLGPGGVNAVINNTVPFINGYKESLEDIIFVDIAEQATTKAKEYIDSKYDNLNVIALQSDFFNSKLNIKNHGKNIALIMGGTIGNFEAEANTPNAVELMARQLQNLKTTLPQNTILLVGLEATQNAETLYASYNHPAHAEFEINIMHGIKRDVLIEENGFDPYAWKYSMQWYPDAHQFCHIAEATELQIFNMLGQDIRIPKGKQFIIDNSFKFPVLAMQRAAQMAKTEYLQPFSDEDGRMVIHAIAL